MHESYQIIQRRDLDTKGWWHQVFGNASKFETIMQFPHLFEFMDLDWLPKSFRNTLRDILECGNAKPFRPYYDWACKTILAEAKEMDAKYIVELGAGTAPLTRILAQQPDCTAVLQPCDLNPDRAVYDALKDSFPSRVEPVETAVDFSKKRDWPPNTLLVLSATLHHLPNEDRKSALLAMSKSAERVLVLEPLRKNIPSVIFVFFSIVPAILIPILFVLRPGGLRRVFWCWIVPLAPLAFLWDGWISCIREWTTKEFESAVPGCVVRNHGLFSQSVHIRNRPAV
jgi:hypothetical protein